MVIGGKYIEIVEVDDRERLTENYQIRAHLYDSIIIAGG